MVASGESRENAWGDGTEHFDASGRKRGESRPSSRGDGAEHFDASGRKVGESRESLWGGATELFDLSGRKTGESREKLGGGGTEHLDSSGRKVGESLENAWGGSTVHYGLAFPVQADSARPARVGGSPGDGFFFDVFGDRPGTRGGLLMQHLVALVGGTVVVLIATLILALALSLFAQFELAASLVEALTYERMTGVLPPIVWFVCCAIATVVSQIFFVRQGRAYLWGSVVGLIAGLAALVFLGGSGQANGWGGAVPIAALWIGYLVGLVKDWVRHRADR